MTIDKQRKLIQELRETYPEAFPFAIFNRYGRSVGYTFWNGTEWMVMYGKSLEWRSSGTDNFSDACTFVKEKLSGSSKRKT